MAAVASFNNPAYCETKALELLHSLQQPKLSDEYINISEQIISLLALARVQRYGNL